MSIEVPSRDIEWLRNFFSNDNQLNWSDIETGKATSAHISSVFLWLKFLSRPQEDLPLILPFYSNTGAITWYGMASDNQVFLQLIDEIKSFIGPSYSDIDGSRALLSDFNDNDAEVALNKRFKGNVIKFSAGRKEDQLEIETALRIYNNLLDFRPVLPERVQRPFGKIRGEFDRALLAKNSTRANELLEELKASGRIDAAQQKCLEVRYLAGLGRKDELADNQLLILSIVDLQLPSQTLVDVIDALYEIYIRPIESSVSSDEILSSFKGNIIRPFGPSLFRDRKGIRIPTVLRSFLLYELVQTKPSDKRCSSILSAYPVDAEGRSLAEKWYQDIQTHNNQNLKSLEALQEVEFAEAISSLEIANKAIVDEDYESAYDLYLKMLPEPCAYSAIMRCAVEINSIDIAKKTIAIVDNASIDIKSKFNQKDLIRLETLRSLCEKQTNEILDSSWVSWAKEVQEGRSLAGSMLVLNENITKWSVDEYRHDVDGCKLLSEIIGNAQTDHELIYREAFPYLVDFFVEQIDQPCRTFTPIYAIIIKILGWTGTLSTDELEIASTLTQAVLSTGPGRNIYKECLEDLYEIISSNNSPIHLDWALNTSELLVLYPEQDNGELRLRIFSKVITMVSAAPHRVTLAQRNILELLAKDYGCLNLLDSLPIFEEEKSSTVIGFKGFIGIYTLMEGAGQRAKVILQKLYPSARIETNSDFVATDRLTSLARNADVFVFAWKSSKHQAYFCVKDARAGKADILLPTGKGAASIVSACIENIMAVAI